MTQIPGTLVHEPERRSVASPVAVFRRFRGKAESGEKLVENREFLKISRCPAHRGVSVIMRTLPSGDEQIPDHLFQRSNTNQAVPHGKDRLSFFVPGVLVVVPLT